MTDTLRLSGRLRRHLYHRSILIFLALSMVIGALVPVVTRPTAVNAADVLAPAPSWMDADTAARLSLAFDVLVPGWIPAPFSEQPSVSASGGYYELYWVITGGDPTFLDITGEVGGDIPDFSWYDRNNELQQNASVGGYPAYRDTTPIYDNVYWRVGDVVYTVSSQGLTATDSLSLANALVALDNAVDEEPVPAPPSPPAAAIVSAPETTSSGDTVSITVSNGNGGSLQASGGIFRDTGSAAYDGLTDATVTWTAPVVSNEQSVTFSLVDAATGTWADGATTIVIPPEPAPLALTCPDRTQSGEQVVLTLSGSGTAIISASRGNWPAVGANLNFDAADGGAELTGAIATGVVTLLWQAPQVEDSLTATIDVSGMSGAAGASCAIVVAPSAAPVSTGAAPSTAATRPTAEAGANDDPSPTSVRGAPTATARPSATNLPATEAQNISPRNRPTRASRTPTEVSTTTPRATGLRSPESDGTGGPRHPSYVGASGAVGGPEPEIAPTNAPMPEAPREIRTVASGPAEATATPIAAARLEAVQTIIGPAGGTVQHPNGATLFVPAGTFASPSHVILRPVPDSELPLASDIEFIPGTGYDIDVRDSAGRPVDRLSRPVSFELPLSNGADSVYSVNGTDVSRMDTVAGDGLLHASLNHFSRFAAGQPRAEPGIPPWLVPWIGIAGFALLILVASTVASAAQRRRRGR